ncbi:MAG: sensor histidine kinase [Acidimicrobiales bacterium]
MASDQHAGDEVAAADAAVARTGAGVDGRAGSGAGLFRRVVRWVASLTAPEGGRERAAPAGSWAGWGVWGEVALVAVAALVGIGLVWMIGHHNDAQPELGLGGGALLAVAVGALPFRQRYPVGVLAVAFAATLAYWSLGYTRGPIWLPLVVALGHVVIVGRRREAIVFLVAGYLGFPWLGYLIGREDRPPLVGLVALAAWLVAVISVSEAVRYRREKAAEAARSQAEAMRRQVTDERLRIARELHDVIAHNMSLISIQAGVALHLMDSKPEQVRTSLSTIKDASKEALVELRSILGVLRLVDEGIRSGPGDGVPRPSSEAGVAAGPTAAFAPRSPVPSLSRLDDLVERARVAGLDVEVAVGRSVGDLAGLPRHVDLAAFRIVQESLTNVARHSDTPSAVVRLDRRDGGLAVDVLDEGSPAPRLGADLPRGGSGLLGMRERAASVGGRLEAGPRPGRGFAVRAWLPLDEDAAVTDDTRTGVGPDSSGGNSQ